MRISVVIVGVEARERMMEDCKLMIKKVNIVGDGRKDENINFDKYIIKYLGFMHISRNIEKLLKMI